MSEFYIDIDKSTGNWTYSLRLKDRPEQVGSQIATFNAHACLKRPNIMTKITKLLNDNIEEFSK